MKFLPAQFVIILFIYSAPVVASETVRVLGHYGSNWASEEGIGFAQEIFQRITTIMGNEDELEVYPILRSYHLFFANEASCYFAGGADNFESATFFGDIDVISSIPFTEDHAHAFTLKTDQKINSYEELNGTSIAISAGLVGLFRDQAEIDINKLEHSLIETMDQALRLMQAKRVNTTIAFISTFKDKAQAAMHYDEHFILHTNVDSLNCLNTPFLVNYIERFNQAISEGINSGAFDDLYEKYQRLKPTLKQN